MSAPIRIADHPTADKYWTGGNFELNMSFEGLKPAEWQQVIEVLWADERLTGPLSQRYVPHQPDPPPATVVQPEPTTTLTQHASLSVADVQVGVDVLVTRSLFECITLMVPVGMFSGLERGQGAQAYPLTRNPARQVLESTYRQIALRLYPHVTFTLASMGWNRECQTLVELRYEDERRAAFFAQGNCLMRDEALHQCQQSPTDYEEVLPGLRWLPPRAE